MPYQYRKLSPKERDEIVKTRRQRGYPLHSPPHPYREHGTYLITAANFEHRDIMHSPERRDEFRELLFRGFHEIHARIVGWVVLRNHYHILVTIESLNPVSEVLKLLHGRTSRNWNLEDNQQGRRVWYKFSDRLMRDEKQLHQSINYIHYNPIKHGYVQDVYHWKWSSVFMYGNELGREGENAHWKNNISPENFGKDWDM